VEQGQAGRLATGKGSQVGPDWRLFLVLLPLALAFVGLRTWLAGPTAPLFTDTDDAMRLVMVRDLLAGQNWFDHVQHNLNTPYGAQMHWSRLVDAPIAAIIALGRPLLGANADIVAAYVWPLLLLGVFLLISLQLCVRMVGRQATLPALVLPLLSAVILLEFSPGRLDHHNVVIILTLALALFTIMARERPRHALWAGLMAATAMAIATEALPQVVVAIAVFGLAWILDPRQGRAMASFGLSFAAASVAHLLIALAPGQWLTPACDALSIVFVLGALLVGLAFAALAILVPATTRWPVRLTLGALAGALALAVIVGLYPQCLAGPYAGLDPWLQVYWIARITEAKPLWESLVSLTPYTLGVLLPILVGLALSLWCAWRGPAERRIDWLVLCGFLVMAVLVMLVQTRGARLAVALAMPGCAVLIGMARTFYLKHRRLLPALGLVATWLVSAGVPIAWATNFATLMARGEVLAQGPGGRNACLVPEAYTALAALPPERVATPIDLGAHTLLYTPHDVLAAPYHRNQQALRDAIEVYGGGIEEARAILAARGITLVVTCPPLRTQAILPGHRDDAFLALQAAGTLPDWFEDVTPPGSTMKLYAVTP